MPDLLTHLAAARVPAAFLRDRRHQALLIAGTFLPDIGTKGLYFVAQAPERFAAPAHSLVGLLLLCYLAALFLDVPLRRAGFACLYGGALLHLFLDLLKENLGMGSLRPFLPFWPGAVELGWIPTEDVVYFLPFDVGVLLLAWLLERRLRRA
ncbi:MAG TPA: metal-dependent hydrolase [Planctomycetota bacterium]